jgi:hypothetical protein
VKYIAADEYNPPDFCRLCQYNLKPVPFGVRSIERHHKRGTVAIVD